MMGHAARTARTALIALVLVAPLAAPLAAQPATRAPTPRATPAPRPAPTPHGSPTPRPAPKPARPPGRPALPALTVTGFSQAEGDSGTTPGTFTIGLSAPSPRPVTVHYATRNGTAIADLPGRPGDYAPVAGTLTLPARTTSATVDVLVRGDRVVEPDEVFYLVLSKPTNATLAVAQATGEILDDDGATGPGSGPTLSIEDAQIGEGDSGRKPMTFVVRLSSASARPVSVDYATADGSATGGEDYQPVSGRLVFTPGSTGRTIAVPVIGDGAEEGDEDFVVQLSNPVNASLQRETARGLILDDDGPGNVVMDLVGATERRVQPGQVVALQVRVHGAGGDPVSGAAIAWAVDGSAELLDGPATMTTRDGMATQRVRVTESPGHIVVRASDDQSRQTVVFQIAVATGPGG